MTIFALLLKSRNTMKAKMIIMAVAALCATSVVAQDVTHIPLVRDGVKWVYTFRNLYPIGRDSTGMARGAYSIELRGDTTLNGISYKKCYFSKTGPEGEITPPTPRAFVRETGGQSLCDGQRQSC